VHQDVALLTEWLVIEKDEHGQAISITPTLRFSTHQPQGDRI
jgi:hypothetical protein